MRTRRWKGRGSIKRKIEEADNKEEEVRGKNRKKGADTQRGREVGSLRGERGRKFYKRDKCIKKNVNGCNNKTKGNTQNCRGEMENNEKDEGQRQEMERTVHKRKA